MFIHFFWLCPLGLATKLNFNISKEAYWLMRELHLLKSAIWLNSGRRSHHQHAPNRSNHVLDYGSLFKIAETNAGAMTGPPRLATAACGSIHWCKESLK